MKYLPQEDWSLSCDNCEYQEEGRHYCLFHSVALKNMDINSCEDWKIKSYENQSLQASDISRVKS